jgi:hypothetical protein
MYAFAKTGKAFQKRKQAIRRMEFSGERLTNRHGIAYGKGPSGNERGIKRVIARGPVRHTAAEVAARHAAVLARYDASI